MAASRLDGNGSKMEGINEFARCVTVYGTPVLLAFLALLLVVRAFEEGYYAGIRSASATLLPIVVGSFLYAYRREVLQRLARLATWIGVLMGAGMGVLVMTSVQGLVSKFTVPLPELVLAGSFTVLVFSSAATPEDRGLPLYYGTLLGILSYVVLFGVPMTGSS